jgi:hypothetical protein
MATPTGTITLASTNVLLSSATSAITSIGGCAVAKIVQVGSDVSAWAANDIILYINASTPNFKETGNTYQVINQDKILFKYVAAP